MNLKKLLPTIAIALTLSVSAFAQNKEIKVGTTSGPDAQIWEVAKQVAAKKGLNIRIIEFSDYIQPNTALAAGDLDANGFQTLPYLKSQIKLRGYKLINVGDTYITPIGAYSLKYKSLNDLPNNATIAIPNDPSNEDRALLLLQEQKVIGLRSGVGKDDKYATLLDVISNPKNIKLIELDAAQLPRALRDVDAAVINTNYALAAGLDPVKHAIARESAKNNPYVNVIAIRAEDKNKPWVKLLVESYQSAEVREYFKKYFQNSTIVAF